MCLWLQTVKQLLPCIKPSQCIITQLPSYDDINLHIIQPHEPAANVYSNCVLKIHNAHESATCVDHIEAQHALLQHLAKHNFPCSRPLPGSDGSSYLMRVQLPSSDNTADAAITTLHIARALSYMPGTVYATVTPTPALRHALGRCIAQLTAVLGQGFDHPGAHRGCTFDWDIRAAPRVVRQYAAYSEDSSALLRAVDLFEKHTAPVADLLPTSIIHGDANEHNVLVNDTPPHDSIVGLLDVGDCHHGWRVAEVGIAAVYQAGMAVAHSGVQEDGGREEEDVLLRVGMQAAGDVLDGYLSVPGACLTTEERQVLPAIFLGRIAQSLALGAYTAHKNPSNAEYVLASQRYNRALLKAMLHNNHQQDPLLHVASVLFAKC